MSKTAAVLIALVLGGLIGFLVGQQVERYQSPVNQALREVMEPSSETQRRVRLATMKSDLRNLVNAQESYWADHSDYTGDLASLNYGASPGVSVVILGVGADGWSARSTHRGGDESCSIFMGPRETYALDPAAMYEGAPIC